MSQENSTFFDDILSMPEPDIDMELYSLERQYKQLFGKSVPRAMLPPSISDDAIKEALSACIASSKDVLLDTLGIKIDSTVLY